MRTRAIFRPMPHALRCACLAAVILGCVSSVAAHPLGNFTINHFTRLAVGVEQVTVHYVVDLAEIPSFQELQTMGGSRDGAPSSSELSAYAGRIAAQYAEGLMLAIDGAPVPLHPVAQRVSLPAGAGGLLTVRAECDFVGTFRSGAAGPRRLHFEDGNHRERIGWRELVVAPADGVSVFDSSAFGSAVTDELRAYPQDLLTAPLEERAAELWFTPGAAPVGAAPLRMRVGRAAAAVQDRFVELVAVPELTLGMAFLALLIAAGLGGLHGLSPGHGKTIVGAYLVGARGTARHAAFLGLTVTITHTLGVFALGLVTLFASQYVVPERMFPVLSFASGMLVLLMGLGLFVARLRLALAPDHHHTHDDAHGHTHHHGHDHGHSHAHSHLSPGSEGAAITWRNLLALGVSGGILPCPSALVVLLSAIALHRIAFGLLLIVAFSAGLASVLTIVGLAFVYAGRFLKRPAAGGRLVRALPVVSALVISAAGAGICYAALAQAGIGARLWQAFSAGQAGLLSTASVLSLGLIFGLKHALDADHLAAVSTIVSERRSLLGSSLIGALWGVGHTISLLVAGIAVIVLHIQIGERTALALEFCVAVMLIGLGASALYRLVRGGRVHFHTHAHGGRIHLHPHVHAGAPEPYPHTHHGVRLSLRPLVIGMVHGLAGSAALMLVVLTTIPSPSVGFAYLGVFGAGSIGGMMIMSALMGLPAQLTALRGRRAHAVVRTLAGVFSLGCGLFMAYQIGVVGRLFV
jgi:ABC-type nickel/cobalt efflux system permease component RcnA